QGSREPVRSHRTWYWKPLGRRNTITCTQWAQVRDHGLTQLNGNTAVVSTSAADALFNLSGVDANIAPPLEGELTASFTGPTTLRVNVYSTNFPSFGFEVFKNGKPIYQNVFQDGSCVPGGPQWGVVGVAALTALLSTGANHGPYYVQTDAKSPVYVKAACQSGTPPGATSAVNAPPGVSTAMAKTNGNVQLPVGVDCTDGPCTAT